MKKSPNYLLLFAALLPLALFVFPMWKITLTAPQYPDGIEMFIWINKMTGDSEFTLQNVNILNHYVGMAKIVPDSIPELKYFPFVVIGIVISGLLVAFSRNQKLLLGWLIAFLALSILGLYDFYLWEYDYGHNLNPMAPIKVPGMSYQPPVFGTKYLLNFRADSYPDLGGLLMGLSIVLGATVFFYERRKKLEWKQKHSSLFASLIFLLSLSSCSIKAEAIDYGKEACHFCKMHIIDPRFGSELVTSKAKVFKFDAIECMLNHLNGAEQEISDYALILVPDYTKEGEFITAEEANFLISEEINSPMGAHLAAFSSAQAVISFAGNKQANRYSWLDLYALFEKDHKQNVSSHH